VISTPPLCLLIQAVNLFNLFITYGDTFLPNPNSYDELYYEIIRMHQVFDNLYSMGTMLPATVCLSVSVCLSAEINCCIMTQVAVQYDVIR